MRGGRSSRCQPSGRRPCRRRHGRIAGCPFLSEERDANQQFLRTEHVAGPDQRRSPPSKPWPSAWWHAAHTRYPSFPTATSSSCAGVIVVSSLLATSCFRCSRARTQPHRRRDAGLSSGMGSNRSGPTRLASDARPRPAEDNRALSTPFARARRTHGRLGAARQGNHPVGFASSPVRIIDRAQRSEQPFPMEAPGHSQAVLQDLPQKRCLLFSDAGGEASTRKRWSQRRNSSNHICCLRGLPASPRESANWICTRGSGSRAMWSRSQRAVIAVHQTLGYPNRGLANAGVAIGQARRITTSSAGLNPPTSITHVDVAGRADR